MTRIPLLLVVALLTICGCTTDLVSPADQSLLASFWVSRTSLGTPETSFQRSDSIYCNYTLRNISNDTLGWGMGDGGLISYFTVKQGDQVVVTSRYDVVPLNAPSGQLAPGETMSAVWLASPKEGVIVPGAYSAVAEPKIMFTAVGRLGMKVLEFGVGE